jgi:signal transduction histidine kinase
MKPPECEWKSGHPWRRRQDWGANGRTVRARFFRRLAAVALLLFLLGVCGVVALAWLAASALGIFTPASHGVAIAVLGGGLLAAVIAVIVLIGTFRRVGMPLGHVMEAAERVADGDYSVRVAEHGPPPIRGLARAFNTMTERLGKHEQQRRNLMADVAHELRTPLTIIQGKLEGLLDGVYAREDAQLSEILGEAKLLSRLIEDLRTLALSEAGVLRLEKEPTDVAELVQDVTRVFATEAFAQQVTLKIEAATKQPLVMIDAVRIRQVLSNILSNALRHTPSGGLIETIVGATDDAEVWVEVHDTGAGMSQAEVERAFERFEKGPESRGSGLGLTIARNLVAAHGGKIQAVSQPGLGTRIRFTLPFDVQH